MTPPLAAAHERTSPRNPIRLRDFIGRFATLLAGTSSEPAILERGAALLAELVRHDDWLADEYAAPDPARYQQYLLHCDSRESFSVVSFVWGPGQATPIHDHTIWGLVGVLRGAELNESFVRDASGALVSSGRSQRLEPGAVAAVSPAIGDVHRVANAYPDRPSISIHVYGANIGAVERSTYDASGQPKRFVSGYANRSLPNLWDRSGAV
jgi:predicted metal-dependent enzyme (double-stranded beta helix superfamily)